MCLKEELTETSKTEIQTKPVPDQTGGGENGGTGFSFLSTDTHLADKRPARIPVYPPDRTIIIVDANMLK